MRILQVNCVYGKGSTGKITKDIHDEQKKRGIESLVCYGRGETVHEPNVYKVSGELYSKFNNLFSRVTGIMYGGCFFSTNRLISIIRRKKPDVVHLHCINGYFVNVYRLIEWLKKHKINTVLTLHAEFMYTANCGHALDCEKWKIGCGSCPRCKQETKSWFMDNTARSFRKMQKAFHGFGDNLVVTSVSPWLMERAAQSLILRDFRHVTVMNGIDTNVFRKREEGDIRNRYGLADKKLVLHVTASFSIDPSHLKGGWYVVELARRMPETIFAVIGTCGVVPNLPKNVLNIGRVEDQRELAAWYSTADVTLLTSKRETFSMVSAESLCCGTPVVGFRAGAPEQIALPTFSEFVEYGDLSALEKAIKRRLSNAMNCEQITTLASQRYSLEEVCGEYCRLYAQVVGEQAEGIL